MEEFYPIGGPAQNWTEELQITAIAGCRATPNCVGVMRYIGSKEHAVYHWGGRPQFCSPGVSKRNTEWVSYVSPT